MSKTLHLYLGIDGGQSSTTAMIGDETGRVIGLGSGGPCNHVGAAEGRPKFVRAIRGCIATACLQAGLDSESVEFQAACLGFSGGPADKKSILDEILGAQNRILTTDAAIALTGATGGQPGIIIIAGTGSISLGRNAKGQTARAGGWGYIYGDEGGGFDIARQAVRAVLRHEEGWGPATVLRDILLSETATQNANDMMHALYTAEHPRPRIAGYSKLVDAAASEGDMVARNIILNAAQQLAT
ncbi:MAG TPA: BadF/BadG/BcrA/BcrD ATPase family protein, partial [Bryobacteraceae bacterium]|nr:BadF/BadG/BcrA/BcrD ATPase family protein [Bryobacteraceae bacterium]